MVRDGGLGRPQHLHLQYTITMPGTERSGGGMMGPSHARPAILDQGLAGEFKLKRVDEAGGSAGRTVLVRLDRGSEMAGSNSNLSEKKTSRGERKTRRGEASEMTNYEQGKQPMVSSRWDDTQGEEESNKRQLSGSCAFYTTNVGEVNCDTLYEDNQYYNCAFSESTLGMDCSGCECLGDDPGEVDDGSETDDGTCFTLNALDSYGDGWNGGYWTWTVEGVASSSGTVYGYSDTTTLCPGSEGCGSLYVSAGSYPNEQSWSMEYGRFLRFNPCIRQRRHHD